MTIKEILQGYEQNKFSARELFEKYFGRIDDLAESLNAFITMADRDKIYRQLEKQQRSQPIPTAPKDMYSTRGLQTTAGSNILKGYIPPYDATVIKRLRENSFIPIAKTNQDAFGHGGTGENSDFGPVRNPYVLDRTPGGSSSGSAAAVAAGLVPFSNGTDTGGSIRLPASFTNTVGIKPTYGLVSRYGVIAMTSSTDTMGQITRTVWDNAYLLNLTAGHDPHDATSLRGVKRDYLADIDKGVQGLNVGFPTEYVSDLPTDMAAAFKESLAVLKDLGARITEISLPHTKYAINAYYIITPSEISSNLARYDGVRFGQTREQFGEEAKRRIMIGTFCLSAGFYKDYYLKAQKVRTLIAKDFHEVFKNIDVIVAPVSPVYPPRLGEVIEDPLQTYLMDVLTVPTSLAGLPALAVPAGFKGQLPRGIQFIGDYFTEQILYRVGYAFEQQTQYYKKRPQFKETA